MISFLYVVLLFFHLSLNPIASDFMSNTWKHKINHDKPKLLFREHLQGLRIDVYEEKMEAFEGKSPFTKVWTKKGNFSSESHPMKIPNSTNLVLLDAEHKSLSVVKRNGTLLWGIRWNPLGDYVSHVNVSRQYLCYHLKIEQGLHWKPGEAGISVMNDRNTEWVCVCRRVSDGAILWQKSDLQTGIPAGKLGEDQFWTIRLSNPKDYYGKGNDPIYYLDLRNLRSGKSLHSWKLPTLWGYNEKITFTSKEAVTKLDRLNHIFNWEINVSTTRTSNNKVYLTAVDPVTVKKMPVVFVYNKDNHSIRLYVKGKLLSVNTRF